MKEMEEKEKERERELEKERELVREKERDESIRILITSLRAIGETYDKTLQQVMERFGLDEKEASGWMSKYWVGREES